MDKSKAWTLTAVILWIIVILLPIVILPVCEPDVFAFLRESPASPHGCTNTLYANTVTGILGLLIALASMKKSMFRISAVITACLGLLVILLPTAITGVCRMATMPCLWGTRPGLIVAGIVIILTGIAGINISKKTS